MQQTQYAKQKRRLLAKPPSCRPTTTGVSDWQLQSIYAVSSVGQQRRGSPRKIKNGSSARSCRSKWTRRWVIHVPTRLCTSGARPHEFQDTSRNGALRDQLAWALSLKPQTTNGDFFRSRRLLTNQEDGRRGCAFAQWNDAFCSPGRKGTRRRHPQDPSRVV